MPTEGQTARGPNGERAVFRGGEWIVLSAPPQQPPVDPAFQYRGEGAALDIEGKRANIQNDRERLQIAREQAALDRQRAAAAAQEAAAKRSTMEARGGVDSTESERTAAFLATRVAGGIQDLTRIGNLGAPSLKDALVGGSLLGNYTTDADRQRAINAQRDILDAALTLGTGAAYTKEQIEAYRASYFAQPGDAPETIRDKNLRLQRLLEASRLKAGASAAMIDDALNASVAPQKKTETINYAQEIPGGLSIADGGSVTDDSPNDPSGGSYQDSYLGQGMSGVNEGIASVLGAPVDLATLAMNAVPAGINAIANTNIPKIERPFLGSEWIGDQFKGLGAVYDETNDPNKMFVRRAAQSVGAAAVPMAGAPASLGGIARGFGIAAGGGIGAAGAQRAFPGNPAAEFAGEVLGSGLTAGGIVANGRRLAMRDAIKAVPSRDELRDQATNLYNVAESRGIVAGPNVTGNMAGRFSQIADDEKLRWPNGKVDPNYTRAGANLDMMEAHRGQDIDPRQIQVMRDNLMDAVLGTKGKEQRIARKMLEAFDAETIPLAPELADARKVASRYLQSDQINKARDLAEANAPKYTNGGMENALRTQFRALNKSVINGKANFNPDAEKAIKRVSEGSLATNAMRRIGKLAPTGIVSGGISAGVPFMIGNALGGPTAGAAASAGSLGIGTLARNAATKMTEREAAMADVIARNGGDLNLGPLIDPETDNLIKRLLAGQGAQYIPR